MKWWATPWEERKVLGRPWCWGGWIRGPKGGGMGKTQEGQPIKCRVLGGPYRIPRNGLVGDKEDVERGGHGKPSAPPQGGLAPQDTTPTLPSTCCTHLLSPKETGVVVDAPQRSQRLLVLPKLHEGIAQGLPLPSQLPHHPALF